MDKNNNSGVKGLADVDTRLKKLNKRVADLEEAMRKLEKVWSLTSYRCRKTQTKCPNSWLVDG